MVVTRPRSDVTTISAKTAWIEHEVVTRPRSDVTTMSCRKQKSRSPKL